MKHSEKILASLRKSAPYLQDQVHREIVDGLRADGLVNDDGDGGAINAVADRRGMTLLTPMAAAADPAKRRILNRVRSEIRQLSAHSYELPMNEPIDIVALNQAIRAGTPEQRIACKAALHELGLIE